MKTIMPGTTVSFVADHSLAARVSEIARTDGVTQSQAAARASALGALLPPAARRTFRFLLDDGDVEAGEQLAALMAKAIAQVGNAALERQLLARAEELGLSSPAETEQSLADQAVEAVAAHHRD